MYVYALNLHNWLPRDRTAAKLFRGRFGGNGVLTTTAAGFGGGGSIPRTIVVGTGASITSIRGGTTTAI